MWSEIQETLILLIFVKFLKQITIMQNYETFLFC